MEQLSHLFTHHRTCQLSQLSTKTVKFMAVQTPCCIARATRTIYYILSTYTSLRTKWNNKYIYKSVLKIKWSIKWSNIHPFYLFLILKTNQIYLYWRYTLIDGWNRGNKDLFESRENEENLTWLQMNLRNSGSKTTLDDKN